jgi:hypothetical protein
VNTPVQGSARASQEAKLAIAAQGLEAARLLAALPESSERRGVALLPFTVEAPCGCWLRVDCPPLVLTDVNSSVIEWQAVGRHRSDCLTVTPYTGVSSVAETRLRPQRLLVADLERAVAAGREAVWFLAEVFERTVKSVVVGRIDSKGADLQIPRWAVASKEQVNQLVSTICYGGEFYGTKRTAAVMLEIAKWTTVEFVRPTIGLYTRIRSVASEQCAVLLNALTEEPGSASAFRLFVSERLRASGYNVSPSFSVTGTDLSVAELRSEFNAERNSRLSLEDAMFAVSCQTGFAETSGYVEAGTANRSRLSSVYELLDDERSVMNKANWAKRVSANW